jgi:hypothetical protein
MASKTTTPLATAQEPPSVPSQTRPPTATPEPQPNPPFLSPQLASYFIGAISVHLFFTVPALIPAVLYQRADLPALLAELSSALSNDSRSYSQLTSLVSCLPAHLLLDRFNPGPQTNNTRAYGEVLYACGKKRALKDS